MAVVLIPKNGSGLGITGSTFNTCCSHPSLALCRICASANAKRLTERLTRLSPAYIAQKCAENGWKFRQVA